MTRRLFAIVWATTAIIAMAATLGGCGVPAVPDFTYYRLPRPAPIAPEASPLYGDIVVDVFGADGLYADQALVYALDADAGELRQYHYQLWTDPPTRVLQRRIERSTVHVGPFLTVVSGSIGLELYGIGGALFAFFVVTVAMGVLEAWRTETAED